MICMTWSNKHIHLRTNLLAWFFLKYDPQKWITWNDINISILSSMNNSCDKFMNIIVMFTFSHKIKIGILKDYTAYVHTDKKVH